MLHLVLAYWLNGNLAMAQQVLLETSEISRRAGHIYIAHFSMYMLAVLQTMQGHLHEAHTIYLQALQPAAQTANEFGSTSVQTASKEWSTQGQSKQPSPATSVVHLGLANLLYEWNDLDAAAYHLSTSIELGQHIGDFRLLPFSYFALARLKLSQGDRDGACELTRKGEHALQQYRYGQSMSQQEAYRIELYIALGNIEEATRLAQGCHANVDDTPAQSYEAEHRAMARLFIARKQTDAAIALLHHQLQAAESEGRIWNVIKLLVLQALALQEQGHAAQAVSVLARALSLAEAEGFVRTFVDEGKPMVALLSEVLAAQQKNSALYPVSPEYVHTLLAALGVHAQPELSHNDAQISLHTLVEPLSEREVEILRLIAAGMSNQEITEKLIIAMSTLKTHINHLYAKLDVHSRTQAIVRARALNLL